MSLSNITISGIVTKDPEKRFTPTNIAVTNFIVDVTYMPRGNQNGQIKEAKSYSIKINAWRDLAEHIESKLHTGDKVLIIGRAQINVYTTQDGKKKREIEIDANSITMLNDVIAIQPSVKSEKEEAPSGFKKSTNNVNSTTDELSEVLASTEEIPF